MIQALTEHGIAYRERILSVVTTLKMQQRGTFELLVLAREADIRGSKSPSLCPTT